MKDQTHPVLSVGCCKIVENMVPWHNSNSYPYKTCNCCLISMSIQEDKPKIDRDKTPKTR